MNIEDAYEAAYRNGYERGLHDSGVHCVRDCECVSNAKVFGLEDSIRGAKFPMSTDVNKLNTELTDGIKALAQSKKGEGHDQWLTGVVVQFDLTFSNKAWVEAERYSFLNFVSSQSTMHRISKFNFEKVYNEFVDSRIIDIIKEKVERYNEYCSSVAAGLTPQCVECQEEIEDKKKALYLDILYNNPAGCQITARMSTNYRQLKTIYSQRRNHRLPEWRTFCKWIETLPMSELITGKDGE